MLRYFIPLVFVFSACRTTNSKTKDAELSPSDIAKPSQVLWQTADNNVRYGTCPAGTTPVNRNCSGLKEDAVMPESEYKDKLTAAIIKSKSAGGTTLNAEGQKDFDSIMTSLQAGNDVIFDQGEARFKLARAPFAGLGFLAYRILPIEAQGNCSLTIVLQKLKLKIDDQYREFVFSKEVSDTKVEGSILNQAVVAESSSSYGGPNSARQAFDYGSAPLGWAPKPFLDSSFKATSLQYLQINFTSPVSMSGIQFTSHVNTNCALKSFRVESSDDGQTFSLMPNAAFDNVAWTGGDTKDFTW